VHPSRIPNLLRFAVNQQESTAAAALVKHLGTSPEQLLKALLEEQQQQQQQQREADIGRQQPPGSAKTSSVRLRRSGRLGSRPDAQQHKQQQHCQEQQQPQYDAQQEQVQFEVMRMHSLQQEQVTPELLNELLLLAAERQHYRVVLQLLELTIPGPQQLPSSTVNTLVHSTMRIAKDLHTETLLVHKLSQLPAANLLDAAQVCSLLLAAVQRAECQIFTLQMTHRLPGVNQLNSTQAMQVAAAAVQSRRSVVVQNIRNVLNLLQPRQLARLLRRTMLLATLAGDGMGERWCDARMQARRTPFPASPWQDRLDMMKQLCSAHAASQLSEDERDELLLTAADLGNGAALSLLADRLPDVNETGSDTATQLLELSLQHRHYGMLSKVASSFSYELQMGYHEVLMEAAAWRQRAADRRPGAASADDRPAC
jgi:hypothetical protein